jgi:FkbM family methyltransferase
MTSDSFREARSGFRNAEWLVDLPCRASPARRLQATSGDTVPSDLIYDVGFHKGEDTEYYLKKGFRVVAVEANPDLCAQGQSSFDHAIRDGRLVIVNRAIADRPGQLTFYRNENTVWGTLDPLWAARNARLGSPSEEITVEAITMAELLEEFGSPHYAKFDIEGFDMIGVKGLASAAERPAYLSVEGEKDSFKALRQEFEILTGLGYDRFKIVPQTKVPTQQPKDVDHVFPAGSSGQFGEEAPGPWLTAAQAVERYRAIFFRYSLVGDDPTAPRWMRSLAWRLGVRNEWYDTHARLAA